MEKGLRFAASAVSRSQLDGPLLSAHSGYPAGPFGRMLENYSKGTGPSRRGRMNGRIPRLEALRIGMPVPGLDCVCGARGASTISPPAGAAAVTAKRRTVSNPAVYRKRYAAPKLSTAVLQARVNSARAAGTDPCVGLEAELCAQDGSKIA